VRAWPGAGEEREREKGDDRQGRLSVRGRRERRARGRDWADCWAARVAGPGKRGRERAGRPRGWAEPEVEKGSGPISNFVFLFQKKCE
jgi:hypothetical protein